MSLDRAIKPDSSVLVALVAIQPQQPEGRHIGDEALPMTVCLTVHAVVQRQQEHSRCRQELLVTLELQHERRPRMLDREEIADIVPNLCQSAHSNRDLRILSNLGFHLPVGCQLIRSIGCVLSPLQEPPSRKAERRTSGRKVFPKHLPIFARLLHQAVALIIEHIISLPEDDITGRCDRTTAISERLPHGLCQPACPRHVLSEQKAVTLHLMPLAILHHNHRRPLEADSGHGVNIPSTQRAEHVSTFPRLPLLLGVRTLVPQLDRHDALPFGSDQDTLWPIRVPSPLLAQRMGELKASLPEASSGIVGRTHRPRSASSGDHAGLARLDRHTHTLNPFLGWLFNHSNPVPSGISDIIPGDKFRRHVGPDRLQTRPSENPALESAKRTGRTGASPRLGDKAHAKPLQINPHRPVIIGTHREAPANQVWEPHEKHIGCLGQFSELHNFLHGLARCSSSQGRVKIVEAELNLAHTRHGLRGHPTDHSFTFHRLHREGLLHGPLCPCRLPEFLQELAPDQAPGRPRVQRRSELSISNSDAHHAVHPGLQRHRDLRLVPIHGILGRSAFLKFFITHRDFSPDSCRGRAVRSHE